MYTYLETSAHGSNKANELGIWVEYGPLKLSDHGYKLTAHNSTELFSVRIT